MGLGLGFANPNPNPDPNPNPNPHPKQEAQRAPTLRDFWRRYLPGEPPQLLYHAQGAQFALPRALIRRRPRSFYRALLDELSHPDPVASYYLELLWYHVFAAPL